MKTINLTKGFVALVDDQDYEELIQHKWSITSNGYAKRCIFSKKRGINKTILMHREIMDTTEWIDHINGNKLDNRRSNLRVCDATTNGMNQGINSKNTSGYKGINWDKSRQKWLVRVPINKTSTNIGRFTDIKDAVKAYNDKIKELYGDYAKLNKI